MDIAGKRIVLTGAASGIGQALLGLLAAYPATLFVVDIDSERLAQACAALPAPRATLHQHTCDLADVAHIDHLFEQAHTHMGGIDCFIANAGFAYYERIAGPDWAHIEAIFRLNTTSPIYSALKMRERCGGQPYTVVITASAMAFCALPGYSLYAATKAALDRFADGYRYELPAGARLTLVYPIATRTNFFSTAGQAVPVPFPSQTPQAVAQAIMRGIERDQDSVHPSAIFSITRVLWRLIPVTRRLYQWLELRTFRRWAGG